MPGAFINLILRLLQLICGTAEMERRGRELAPVDPAEFASQNENVRYIGW